MRTLLQALTDLIEPRLIQPGTLELREDAQGSTCPPTVLQKSGKGIALRLGSWRLREREPVVELAPNQWLFPLFRSDIGDPPVCRSCDYVIFYAPRNETGKLFVFLCELKSGGARGTLQQIRNVKLLVDHALEVVRLHGRIERWPTEIVFRGLIFAGDAPNQKGTTRVPFGVEYQDDRGLPGLKTTVQRPGGSYDLAWFCN
jgi:hypothetical protein